MLVVICYCETEQAQFVIWSLYPDNSRVSELVVSCYSIDLTHIQLVIVFKWL